MSDNMSQGHVPSDELDTFRHKDEYSRLKQIGHEPPKSVAVSTSSVNDADAYIALKEPFFAHVRNRRFALGQSRHLPLRVRGARSTTITFLVLASLMLVPSFLFVDRSLPTDFVRSMKEATFNNALIEYNDLGITFVAVGLLSLVVWQIQLQRRRIMARQATVIKGVLVDARWTSVTGYKGGVHNVAFVNYHFRNPATNEVLVDGCKCRSINNELPERNVPIYVLYRDPKHYELL